MFSLQLWSPGFYSQPQQKGNLPFLPISSILHISLNCFSTLLWCCIRRLAPRTKDFISYVFCCCCCCCWGGGSGRFFQGLLLPLCCRIIPDRLREHMKCPGIESRSALGRTSAAPPMLFLFTLSPRALLLRLWVTTTYQVHNPGVAKHFNFYKILHSFLLASVWFIDLFLYIFNDHGCIASGFLT